MRGMRGLGMVGITMGRSYSCGEGWEGREEMAILEGKSIGEDRL